MSLLNLSFSFCFLRNIKRRKKWRFLISPPSIWSTIHKVRPPFHTHIEHNIHVVVKDLVPGSCRFRHTRTDPCCESRSIKASRLVILYLCYSDFAEKLLKQLESSNERFEVKIMMMELISRLVGIHEVMYKWAFAHLWFIIFSLTLSNLFCFHLYSFSFLISIRLSSGSFSLTREVNTAVFIEYLHK